MAITYQGVRLGLRWIAPGTFTMGSPDDEGRFDNEVLHPVTLTNGFWLAETTVTKALWQAVMEGENSSQFKGDNRPVEQVNWHDALSFIQQLNALTQALQPEYVFRLPTEAEWEYACRAGTQTPFNFDGELTLNKVNYWGTWNDHSQGGGAWCA